ncbi:MAG: 5-methyltetrahydropteroyltriglutamate--homocysteine S-methyltransferase, partial [Xanthobacteraceae bacterium]
MQRTRPPFRADHVGSLLRTAALKEAREQRANGALSAEAFKAIEDREVEGVIKKQEAVGLKSITDGEYRRISWNIDFLEQLYNVESYAGERKVKFASSGPQPRQVLLRVIGKLGGYKPHPMIEHFKFLKAHTKQMPKMTIPSPSSLHFRYGRDAVPEALYPNMNDFYGDLGMAYNKVVQAFAETGCRYLQLDEVNLTYLCDPSLRKLITDRGEDPATLSAAYAKMINAAIAGIPADMAITMHLCRGNFRSNFVASGGYEPVAEMLFDRIKVHGYFMEYDTARAGGFEPLRRLQKGRLAVLGLVTTKTGTL